MGRGAALLRKETEKIKKDREKRGERRRFDRLSRTMGRREGESSFSFPISRTLFLVKTFSIPVGFCSGILRFAFMDINCWICTHSYT